MYETGKRGSRTCCDCVQLLSSKSEDNLHAFYKHTSKQESALVSTVADAVWLIVKIVELKEIRRSEAWASYYYSDSLQTFTLLGILYSSFLTVTLQQFCTLQKRGTKFASIKIVMYL